MGKEGMVYKKDLICDICGVMGAYDFLDDDIFVCPECLGQSLIKSISKFKREVKNMYRKNKKLKGAGNVKRNNPKDGYQNLEG